MGHKAVEIVRIYLHDIAGCKDVTSATVPVLYQ